MTDFQMEFCVDGLPVMAREGLQVEAAAGSLLQYF